MNILIVGLGSIAQKHIKAINCINKDLKIFALRSDRQAKAYEGVINVFDLENVKEVFDFAIISNPTHLHFKYINVLADKDIPLFIEKPPVHSLENIEILLKKIQDKHLITYVACNLRFHPCIQYLKKIISENTERRINELNVYCGSYLPEWRPGKDFRAIYSANEEMGGGVHLDLFHELDYTQWIFGKPIKSHCLKRNASSLNIDAFDYANYILEYHGFTASIILNYYRRMPKRVLEILFEDETWQIDLISNKIFNDKGVIIYQPEKFEMMETYIAQMNYFIDCLANNQTPMNSLGESFETLKTCLSNEL